ncbi:ribose 1,5-bisphosphokinase [Marinomonas colpomeniae]|uniref:ribose 1,5-bisphosphate phosphokinase n=1 Tax=Marinomonas colpomeniae TaxID=2774408 RepID=A0ABR8NZ50_9GAMM|nr:ribose 1,5-bisphosphokinase [Marinomonas colpomeniae]MBD5771323.1 ribose 1,5-bisphosphokinase [Marinomonas colpomeniae]
MGKIIYLIGASGSGKDSILSGLRLWLNTESSLSTDIIIAHRYICRDWQSGNENHIELSKGEFLHRQQIGLFALHWQANGLYYGIGREIDLWLAEGQNIIINGSREYLPIAMSLYGKNLVPVLIHVDEVTLRQRLIARGRESLADIEARLARTRDSLTTNSVILNQCHVIHNNAQIDDVIQQLIVFINSLVKRKKD